MSIATIFPPLAVMAPTEYRLSVEGSDGSDDAVDERRVHDQAEPRIEERLAGDRPRPADLSRSARWTKIRAQHDVRVQHLEQRLEVAVARGREERVDDSALSLEVGVGNRRLALDAAARTAGELPCRLRRAVDDRRDLVEGHGENVVQHEGEPLGRRQRLQHDEQRQADRVRQQCLVLRVGPVGAVDDRVGQANAERLLAPHVA
jgi:hypothetical protein